MKTKIIKNQKPVSIDLSLKYICPNIDCKYEHWLFLRETKIKNFKVVCECGCIFQPKRIHNISIKYIKKHKKKDVDSKYHDQNICVNENLIKKATPAIVQLGFTTQEAKQMLSESYLKQPTSDITILIKNTLLETRNNGELSETI